MTPVDGADLAERATRAAANAGAGVQVEAIEQLPGGHSGLTLAAQLVTASGAHVPIVIKATPPGRKGTGRHDVLRQARLYRALEAVDDVAVPEVLFEDRSEPAFFAMTRLRGDALEPIFDGSRGVPPRTIHSRSAEATQMLAALHAFDASPFGSQEQRSLAEELDRWEATAQAADPAITRGADALVAALRRTLPREGTASLIHGDYRLGNILCDGPRVEGIIDWEIWTVTDPRLDLAWYLVHFDPDNYPGLGTPVEGLPSPEQVLHHYESSRGEIVEDWPWFDAFGRLKVSAIVAHNLRRHREGRHVDSFQERLAPAVSYQIRTGLAVLGVS